MPMFPDVYELLEDVKNVRFHVSVSCLVHCLLHALASLFCLFWVVLRVFALLASLADDSLSL